MAARIVQEQPQLRLTCPRCKSVIAYEPTDLRDCERVSLFGFVVGVDRVLDCPNMKCRAVIRPVTRRKKEASRV